MHVILSRYAPAVALAISALVAQAAPLVFDANVTNNTIYGGGNSNGSWTVDRDNNVELGLRAKVRYAIADDLPKNVYNSNGAGTYNHAAGSPAANSTRARWNFDFSVNTDRSSDSGRNVSALTYKLGIDLDPGLGNSWASTFYDPITGAAISVGNSYGDNTTLQGQGVEAGGYAALAASNNLVQNSINLDFLDGPFGIPFNPAADGVYSFYLAAFNADGTQLARTQIDVIVGAGVVPEPGTMALVGVALLGLTAVRRRKTH